MERCYQIKVPRVGQVRARLGRAPTPETLEALSRLAQEVQRMDQDGRLAQLEEKNRRNGQK